MNYFGKNEVKIITESNYVKEIKDFEMGSEVEFSVHISHLWLKDKKVGINYDICQNLIAWALWVAYYSTDRWTDRPGTSPLLTPTRRYRHFECRSHMSAA